MSPLITLGIATQILALSIFIRRMGRHCLGSIGFTLMAVTFVFHGLTELVQGLFPGMNNYREGIDEQSLEYFVLIMGFGMLCFTICYFMTPRQRAKPNKLQEVIVNLDTSYLLKWQVLAAIGVPSFVLIALRDQASSVNYWTGGLTDQFTPYLLMIGFITFCLRMKGKYIVFSTCAFIILLITAGSRTLIGTAVAVGVCTLARVGIRLPARTVVSGGLAVVLCFGLLSMTRKSYGRFNSGESVGARLDAIGNSIQGSGDNQNEDTVLDDTVYRFDGNSYGAMILDKQSQGYPITGLAQLGSTIGYMIPSFLYPDKLNLRVEDRNEEAYTTAFYQLPEDVDFVSDLWSLLLSYSGAVGLLICFACFGFLLSRLDNWLITESSAVAYLAGFFAAMAPFALEQSVSGLIYLGRGFVTLLILDRVLSFFNSSSRPLARAGMVLRNR